VSFGAVGFGRRRAMAEEAAPAPQAAAPERSISVVTAAQSAPPEAIAELRVLCLARLEPAAVAALTPERLATEVERLISEIATDRRVHLNAVEQRMLAQELVNDMLGLGPLQPLLDDERVADIMVNGPNKVFVERGGKVELSNVKFRDESHLAGICQRIAAAVGRRVDEASPMVDARLKDGSRVNIVFPPLALDGPSMSIRKFSKKPIDFERLVGFGALTRPVAKILSLASASRLNIIISGGTGSGKTTMMNALSRLIHEKERVITVEDAAELQLQQPHVVRLETRPMSLEGKGEITQRDLVRNALRMRPDRIIIGEVRGGEAFDMLQAMNTGHEGSMATIHANNPREAITRLEQMVAMGGMNLSNEAVRGQIAAAVGMVVQVMRLSDGKRKVMNVTEITGMEGNVVQMQDIFVFRRTRTDPDGTVHGEFRATGLRPKCLDEMTRRGIHYDPANFDPQRAL